MFLPAQLTNMLGLERVPVEAEPCPFCQSREISLVVLGEKQTPVLIHCDACGAAGPLAHTTEQFIERWNNRATKLLTI